VGRRLTWLGVARCPLAHLPSVLSRFTSSTVLQRMGTKFGRSWNFLPPVMDSSLLVLDWATCRGFPEPPFGSMGWIGLPLGSWVSVEAPSQVWWHLDTSPGRPTPNVVARRPLCPNLARPVLRSSGRHNFVIRTPNWVNQNLISCISTSSSTWCSQNGHLMKSFYHAYSHLVPTLT
jgi:hypothetical protein